MLLFVVHDIFGPTRCPTAISSRELAVCLLRACCVVGVLYQPAKMQKRMDQQAKKKELEDLRCAHLQRSSANDCDRTDVPLILSCLVAVRQERFILCCAVAVPLQKKTPKAHSLGGRGYLRVVVIGRTRAVTPGVALGCCFLHAIFV